jgi:hypothetical protein
MTAFVDVRFRGLRVAHKAKLTEGDDGAFVEFEQPLPVGSPLSVVEEGKSERPARVIRVVEHEAGAGPAGMRLTWDSGAVLREEAITVKVEKTPTFEEPSAAVAAASPAPEAAAAPVSADGASDASSDGSIDSSDDGGDRSTDGTVEAPVQNGNSSKKSKKNKKRR